MWIIPSNHPLYSQFAQVVVESKSELREQLDHFGAYSVIKNGKPETLSNLPFMWKSNPLSPTIWLRKWSKVYWLPLLFGRTLKHSHGGYFGIKYASSLEDIHASPSVQPESSSELMIRDTSTHISNTESMQLNLFAASSKTSATTSISDTERSDILWKRLVTRLKREYSRRKKLARHTYANAYSSSPWPTPTAQNRVRDEETLQKCLAFRKANANQNTVPLYLEEKVRLWKTPISSELEGGKMKILIGKDGRYKLRDQVMELAWPTPSARDWRSGKSNQHEKNSRPLNEVAFHQDKGNTSKDGNILVLNPAWVLQLMGTTLQKTFFAWREMPSLSSNLNSPLEHS